MSKIKLYIAATLDGYIADSSGSVDWLMNYPNPDKNDFGYQEFYNSIDKVLIGRTTYEQVLRFADEYVYKDKSTVVFSRNKEFKIKTENSTLYDDVNTQVINKIKEEAEKDIWLVGGGKLVADMLDLKAIDEMILFIFPVILGKGIRLFPESNIEQSFELKLNKSHSNGVVELHYSK